MVGLLAYFLGKQGVHDAILLPESEFLYITLAHRTFQSEIVDVTKQRKVYGSLASRKPTLLLEELRSNVPLP